MTITDFINWLSIIALLCSLVVMAYLIVILSRANRVLYKLDHLSESFAGFVKEVMPAIVNIGTVTTAVHSVLQVLSQKPAKETKPKK